MKAKHVRNFFIVVILIAMFAFLFDITTPKECKNKPVSQLSQFCLDLLYP